MTDAFDSGAGQPPASERVITLLCSEAAGAPYRPVRIVADRCRIGRRPDNDVIVTHVRVSRHHAELVCEQERWFVVDNDSKFGTYLNGERIVRAALSPGDEIRLGAEDGPLVVFQSVELGDGDPTQSLTEPPSPANRDVEVAGLPGSPPSVDSATDPMRLVERFHATSLVGSYQEALELVVDASLQLTRHSFAALLVFSDEVKPRRLRPEVVRFRDGAPSVDVDRVCATALAAVRSGTTFQYSANALPPDSQRELFEALRIAGVDRAVCVPVVVAPSTETSATGESTGAVIGALYLEDSSRGTRVTDRVREVLESLATEAGRVIERLKVSRSTVALRREHLVRVATERAAQVGDEALSSEERARAACELAQIRSVIGENDTAIAELEAFYESTRSVNLPAFERALMLKMLGTALMWQAKWHRAVGILNSAIDTFAELRDVRLEMETRVLLARCYNEIGEPGIAREYVLTSLSALRQLGDRSTAYALVLIIFGILASQDGDLASAAHALGLARRIGEETGDFVIIAAAQLRLGMVQYERGDTSEAIASFNHFLEIAQSVGNNIQLAIGQAALAACLVRSGAWRQADVVIAGGIAAAKRSGRTDALGQLLLLAATIAVLRDGGDAAERALAEFRAYAEKADDSVARLEADLLESQRALYARDFGRARSILAGSIDGAGPSTPHGLLARAHLLRAEVERQDGKSVAATSAVEQAQDIISDDRNLLLAGLIQLTLGRIHADAGQRREAQHCLAQSLSTFRTIGDQRLVGLAHLDIGRLMLVASDPNCARTHLTSAVDIFRMLDSPRLIEAAQSALDAAIASGGVSSMGSYSSVILGARSETRFVRRLVEAAQSRELLMCEVTAVALDVAGGTSALVVSRGDDGGISILASSGERPSGELPVADLVAGTSGQLVRTRDATIYPMEVSPAPESGGAQTALYINVAPAPGSRPDQTLLLVTQLARQGFELIELRGLRNQPNVPLVAPLDAIRAARVSLDDGLLIGDSAGMRRLTEQILRIRTTSSTVLITGESGVGKELVARAIHGTMSRPKAPFVPFNCTAVPRDLIESQLFGHRKGAFTGAASDFAGLARTATNGTLFLDEIGDLPLDLQPKLLRFLESGEIMPLGATAPLRVELRVVAATNANLEQLVKERRFREDLYHRLNIIRLHVPPLRERSDDIPLLVEYFLSMLAARAGRTPVPRMSAEALEVLMQYSWPGNVRELRNEIERSLMFSELSSEITLDHLSDELRAAVEAARPGYESAWRDAGGEGVLAERLRRFEVEEIRRALNDSGMNLTRAAASLGMARQNLQRRLKKLGLNLAVRE